MSTNDQEAIEIRNLGPEWGTPQGMRWWARHQSHAQAWLRQEVAGGLVGMDLAEYAAWSLLRIPEARGVERVPGEPSRKALSWDGIDAYEILFVHVVDGGLWDSWDPREYLRLLGSFARYLGERGIIPAAEHEQLQAQWAQWSRRLLEVWDTGSWYLRDGTHWTPEELERRARAAKRARASASQRLG